VQREEAGAPSPTRSSLRKPPQPEKVGRLALDLHHGARLSVRCQLATRLAGLIRDGYLAPGTRLPSIRELADDLGLHRNTVWACYRRLESAKLVVAVQGRGVFVQQPDCGRSVPSEHRLAGFNGPGGREKAKSSFALCLLEPWPRLRDLLQCELLERVGVTVEAIHPRSLGSTVTRPLSTGSKLFLGRRPVVDRLHGERELLSRVVPLDLSGGSQELEIVSRLPSHAVVTVLTGCASVRQYARALVRSMGPDRLGFASPRPTEMAAVKRVTRIADIVFVDSACTALVDRRVCPHPVRLRLLSARTIDSLRRARKCRAE
jgi:hypothetical protein